MEIMKVFLAVFPLVIIQHYFPSNVGINAPEYDEAPLNLVASHVAAAEESH